MGHGGHAGHVLEQLDVLRLGAEVVVGDHGAHGLAAELAVLRRVDALVEAGLHHFGGVLEVREQVLLGYVDELDPDVLAEVRAVH